MAPQSGNRSQSIRATLRLSGFVVTVIIAGVVGVVIFAVLHFNPATAAAPQPTPAERVISAFYHAAALQDYGTAYTYFAPEQQAIITAYSFKLSADLLDAQEGKITTYHAVRVDRDAAHPAQVVVQESVTRTHQGSYTVSVTLAPQSDGSWRIISESGV